MIMINVQIKKFLSLKLVENLSKSKIFPIITIFIIIAELLPQQVRDEV